MYDSYIFPNGRIALVNQSDFNEAVNLGKEILIFCGGWSGGYAKAVGANIVNDPDFGECWEMYGYDIKDETLSAEDMQKFHKVIITNGVKVYMKTGESANRYFGSTFADYDTSYEDFVNKWNYKCESKEEFEKLRFAIDADVTKKMLGHGQEAEEIWNSIKGNLDFYSRILPGYRIGK